MPTTKLPIPAPLCILCRWTTGNLTIASAAPYYRRRRPSESLGSGTLVSRKREHFERFLGGLIVVVILAGHAAAVSAQSADLSTLNAITAKQYLVADTATGEVFAEKDSGTRHGIA